MTDGKRVTVRLSPERVEQLDTLVAAGDIADHSAAIRLGLDLLFERRSRRLTDGCGADDSLRDVFADDLGIDRSISADGGLVNDE